MPSGAQENLEDADPPAQHTTVEDRMIVVGGVLLILGFMTGLAIIETIGVILLIIGLVLMLAGQVGRRPVAGRRHYW